MTGPISRKAAKAVAAADAPARVAEPSAASSGVTPRVFRIRHAAMPPFEWELHLQGLEGQGHDLILSLPRGLPWGQDESRVAEPLEAPGVAPAWDEGRYHVEAREDGQTLLRFEGARVRGRYALSRGKGRVTLQRVDPASVRPFPDRILPMLAHAAPFPANEEEYAFELKWDGVRAIAYLDGSRLTLRSRNLNNITAQYPELQPMATAFGGRQLVLDGEIVAPDQRGIPSFQRLQNRLGVVAKGVAQQRSGEVPVVYIVFDVLYLDGHDVMALPYEERRAILESLPLHGPAWRLSPARVGEGGRELLAMPGWEGVVAKRLGSPYEPGARSRAWIKIKQQKRQELVIGGWSAGRGAREGRIGSLLVGYYDATPDEAREAGREPRFLYAGSVGTGFTGAMLEGLQRLLAPDVRATSPFAAPVDKKDVTFVEPRYVAEFEFTEWTSDGKLRHPSYKGLREDKDPRHVVREET